MGHETDLIVSSGVTIPLSEVRFATSRSSGPGGQNVNKVATKAVLHWDVAHSRSLPESVRERFMAKYHRRITKEGELVLQSQRFRDRGRNVADCTEKLRQMLLDGRLLLAILRELVAGAHQPALFVLELRLQ